ncbi:MAG: polysaccharide lyase [Myxococcota bacterium]
MSLTYEDGSEDSGNPDVGANIPSTYRRDIVTDLKRRGRYSVRHKLKISDPEDPVAGSMRSESHNEAMLNARITPGQIRYYGFSIYFPTTWETDAGSDDIVFQWKGFGGPPFMFITQKHDDIVLRFNYDSNVNPSQGTIVKQSAVLAPLTKGKWHDFRFRVVWEYRDNGVGRINVDHKLHTESSYTRVLNYAGPTMFNRDGYLKWGIYKPSWDKAIVGGYAGSVEVRNIWHDNVRVGSTWEEVDPADY